MRTGRSPLALLLAGCFSISSIVIAQGAQPTETAALLRSPTLSPEGRKAIQDRIDAVHAKFRAAHGGPGPEQFGLQCCQITQIPATAFTGQHWTNDSYGYFYPPSGGGAVKAPVQLPSGVAIWFLDLYYYDDDDGGSDMNTALFALAGQPHHRSTLGNQSTAGEL